LRPEATLAAQGTRKPPSAAYGSTRRSKAAQILRCIVGAWPRMLAEARARLPRPPCHHASELGTRCTHVTSLAATSSSPAALRSARSSVSSEKRNTGRAGGQTRRRRGSGLAHGIEEHAVHAVPRGQLPPRDRRHSAAREDAHELRHRALGAREVADAEVADNGVEGARVEGQRLCIGLTELDPRVEGRGEGDHPRREVGADDPRGSALGRSRGDAARAARDVEDATARAHARGVEERHDRAAGHRLEEIVIAAGHPLVRGALEIPERFSIHRAPRA